MEVNLKYFEGDVTPDGYTMTHRGQEPWHIERMFLANDAPRGVRLTIRADDFFVAFTYVVIDHTQWGASVTYVIRYIAEDGAEEFWARPGAKNERDKYSGVSTDFATFAEICAAVTEVEKLHTALGYREMFAPRPHPGPNE